MSDKKGYYAWAITKDHLFDPNDKSEWADKDEAKTVGPRYAELTYDEIVKHPDREHFMIYDDDMELYYSGFMVHGKFHEDAVAGGYAPDESDGFEPLEDFGTPNAGAAHIKYKDKKSGKYEFL